MTLTPIQREVLSHIRKVRHVRLSRISEPMRQKIIELGTAEPPLIDAMGDFVSVTGHGLSALAKQ